MITFIDERMQLFIDSRRISDAPGINKVINNFHELIGDYQEQIIALLDKVEKNMASELEKIK